jgi:predicted nuclease with TOPRIM domain
VRRRTGTVPRAAVRRHLLDERHRLNEAIEERNAAIRERDSFHQRYLDAHYQRLQLALTRLEAWEDDRAKLHGAEQQVTTLQRRVDQLLEQLAAERGLRQALLWTPERAVGGLLALIHQAAPGIGVYQAGAIARALVGDPPDAP